MSCLAESYTAYYIGSLEEWVLGSALDYNIMAIGMLVYCIKWACIQLVGCSFKQLCCIGLSSKNLADLNVK